QTLDDPRWKTLASAISSGVLSRIRAGGWTCGVPQGVETPGLLAGLAGIGYGLLRLASPAVIPSILGLGPPNSWQRDGQACLLGYRHGSAFRCSDRFRSVGRPGAVSLFSFN